MKNIEIWCNTITVFLQPAMKQVYEECLIVQLPPPTPTPPPPPLSLAIGDNYHHKYHSYTRRLAHVYACKYGIFRGRWFFTILDELPKLVFVSLRDGRWYVAYLRYSLFKQFYHATATFMRDRHPITNTNFTTGYGMLFVSAKIRCHAQLSLPARLLKRSILK